MDFVRISILQEGPYKEIMKEFLQFKKKILKQLDKWEQLILKRFDQGIEHFTLTRLIYPCIEPVVNLDKFYNSFRAKLKTKKNILEWEQVIDDSLKQFQKNMKEMYEITMKHFKQPTILQPNLIHYIFQPEIGNSFLNLQNNRIRRVIKPNGKWQLAFLQPQLDYTTGVNNDENQISFQIIDEGQSMIGVACPSQYLFHYEYPKKRTDFYSISSQGYIETIVQNEQKEDSVFTYKPLDMVSIIANKNLKTLIFKNLTTRTVQKISFNPKEHLQYHFFVGLRKMNEEVVIHTII